MQVHETPIFEIIFMTLTKDSFDKTNDTQGPEEYTKTLEIAVKTRVTSTIWHNTC